MFLRVDYCLSSPKDGERDKSVGEGSLQRILEPSSGLEGDVEVLPPWQPFGEVPGHSCDKALPRHGSAH